MQEANVSMIITDYWMPEMTGYELLKKVKVMPHDNMQPFSLSKSITNHTCISKSSLQYLL
jgi:two-component response regulator (ARR-A family)